jgi:putative copper resistance protein D
MIEVIEVIAALIRWLALASNMILIGGCVFLAIAVRPSTAFDAPWLAHLERALPWLAISLLLGLLGLLATTTAQVTGVAASVWRPDAWFGLLQNTRIGHIWMGRAALALLLFGVVLYVRFSPRARWRYLLCASVAALTLAVASLASHSAAGELSVTSVLPYALHIVLASVWFGGLPAFLTVMFSATGKRSREGADRSGIQTLKHFSAMALPVMIAVVATGIIVADRMVDTSYASLVATSYGWFLNAKLTLLAVILVIAARARLVWLPSLGQNEDVAAAGGRGLRRWVTVEVVLAAALVLVATMLANAVPAKHDVIENWPYPFRFSIDATWGWSRAAWPGRWDSRTRSDQALEDEVAHCHPGRAGGRCAGRGTASPCRSGLSGNLPQDAGPVRCHFCCQRCDPVRRELRALPRTPSQGQWRSGQDLA